MSSRAVCTADGESSRLRCLHPPNGGTSSSQKIRRTRKAPDFYSPETPSSKTETKSKKVDSDENDSWKPESDSDEVESASESERSTGRHRTGPRRRLTSVQKGPSPDPNAPLLHTPNDSSGNSDLDEKPMKKEETPQKKIKGVRELQNLLDGHAQVHKESRYRRLASRRDRRGPGISESTWSNASSSKALEEKPLEVDPDPDPKPKPLLKASSSDMDPEGDLNGEGHSSKQSVSFQNGSHTTTKSKSESLTNGGGGLRAKRQRLDLSNSFGNEKVRENGQRRNSFPQAKTADFKLPRLPMIKYGDYWYRARIKKEDRESIYVEFTGFEDSPLKPFWIRKDSDSVFKGSYSGKDWKYLGEGSWEPRPRKLVTKKSNGRRRKNGRKRRALPSVAESVATAQGSKIGNFNDVLINADSDVEFTKSASAILGRENGDCSSPKIPLNEHQSRYRAASSNHVIDPVLPESSLDPRSAPEQDKSLDQEGSQSMTAQEKVVPSMESLHDQASTRQHIESPIHGDGVKPGTNDDNSPLSRTGASPVNIEEDTQKPIEDRNNSNQALNNNSSSIGVDLNEDRVVQQRCRRKQTPMTNFRRLRSEDDPISTRRPNELRRSARLGWKTSWKSNFKDDSSSEAECEDESLQNTNSNRRNLHPGRNGGPKYLNRASGNLEIMTHGRNGVGRSRRCVYQTRSKRMRRSNRSKDEFDLEEGSFDLANGPSDDLRQYYGSQVLDGMEVFSLGVNAFAQIRKYLPYYNSHIADARLPSFVELMEKLDGIKAEQLTTRTTTTSSVHQSKSKDGLRIGKQQLENNLSLDPPPPPPTARLDSSEIQP